MRFTAQTGALILGLLLSLTIPVFAGGLPPCTKAVESPHGNFLVISNLDLEPMEGGAFRVRRLTLQVFPKEKFINAKDKVTAPVTYWADWLQWSVILDSSNSHLATCPDALITDDGEFLILLNRWAMGTAMRIYRRRDHLGDPVREGPDHGVLVRDVPLREICPPDKLQEAQTMSGESPEWFAGGSFEFSADSRVLIHQTRWGETVRINLEDGSVDAPVWRYVRPW